MRSYLYESLNLDKNFMEFAFLLKRGCINSLQFYIRQNKNA